MPFHTGVSTKIPHKTLPHNGTFKIPESIPASGHHLPTAPHHLTLAAYRTPPQPPHFTSASIFTHYTTPQVPTARTTPTLFQPTQHNHTHHPTTTPNPTSNALPEIYFHTQHQRQTTPALTPISHSIATPSVVKDSPGHRNSPTQGPESPPSELIRNLHINQRRRLLIITRITPPPQPRATNTIRTTHTKHQSPHPPYKRLQCKGQPVKSTDRQWTDAPLNASEHYLHTATHFKKCNTVSPTAPHTLNIPHYSYFLHSPTHSSRSSHTRMHSEFTPPLILNWMHIPHLSHRLHSLLSSTPNSPLTLHLLLNTPPPPSPPYTIPAPTSPLPSRSHPLPATWSLTLSTAHTEAINAAHPY